MLPISAVIGLGNIGKIYTKTRHNAGFWFIEKAVAGIHFSTNKYLSANHAVVAGVHYLLPNTLMNRSGTVAAACLKLYGIAPEQMLVAHDDIDLPAGVARIKVGGGHGGHNGLRDIIHKLGSANFIRVRIGVGRPTTMAVESYVLQQPTQAECQHIQQSIADVVWELDTLLQGNIQQAQLRIHTSSTSLGK